MCIWVVALGVDVEENARVANVYSIGINIYNYRRQCFCIIIKVRREAPFTYNRSRQWQRLMANLEVT